IGGPQGDKPMSVDRELILTELLALNFNENFEMKPLMEDAIKRLAAEKGARGNEGEDPREPLWSIVRRIAERQKASIGREWSASDSSPSGCILYYLNLDARTDRHAEPVTGSTDCQISAAFGDIVDMKSP